jgi:xanthine dehydrogenase accessory factor
VTDERAWEVGLACGGTVELAVQRLADPSALEETSRLLEARRPAVLALDLATGAARVVRPDEAGCVGPLADAARAAIAADASRTFDEAGRETFLRVFNPTARVVLVGATHVAQAVVTTGRAAGLEPLVIDPRPAWALERRFAGCSLLREWPDAAIRRLAPDARTAVVTLSHDPKLDDPALLAALRSSAFYVGALGSRRTHAARRERLRELGSTDAELDRVHAPVGLAIGAVSPGEIAVAILAEIVAELRRDRRGRR